VLTESSRRRTKVADDGACADVHGRKGSCAGEHGRFVNREEELDTGAIAERGDERMAACLEELQAACRDDEEAADGHHCLQGSLAASTVRAEEDQSRACRSSERRGGDNKQRRKASWAGSKAWRSGCAALAESEQGNRGERESGGGAGWGEARLGFAARLQGMT
jgi:hypothetical protein